MFPSNKMGFFNYFFPTISWTTYLFLSNLGCGFVCFCFVFFKGKHKFSASFQECYLSILSFKEASPLKINKQLLERRHYKKTPTLQIILSHLGKTNCQKDQSEKAKKYI